MFDIDTHNDFSIFSQRINKLLEKISKEYAHVKHGCIVLAASFENSRTAFRQDSTFYYYTGINEPGVVLLVDLDNTRTLMVPQYAGNRSCWILSQLASIVDDPDAFGIDDIEKLGAEIPGHQMSPWMSNDAYSGLIQVVNDYIEHGGTIFVMGNKMSGALTDSYTVFQRLNCAVPGFNKHYADISPLVAQMRRSKDMSEIERLFSAVEISVLAHEAAAQAIAPDVLECEVQAQVEYIFTAGNARIAFPTIVASGQSSTVLHYEPTKDPLVAGDVVIVDCGAELNSYCGDLSRTYPVSGTFNARQKELYNLVLELQTYISSLVKPGFWFTNSEEPEKSLNHLARKFLHERGGYDVYFTHGIGHFLGLDVHDIGDVNIPLAEGDVFTIEPGLYLPDEKIGIRIEDNFWLTKNGAICLSEALPRKPEEIELFMKAQFSYHEEEQDPTDSVS